jgi:glutathione S-transferase
MSEFTLHIGNKAYSSWSLRGWLACKLAGIAFREEVHDMGDPDWPDFVRSISPSARVPVLRHGEIAVWESLAIGDYLADLHPQAGLWPEDRAARAEARAISAEMHAGFTALRSSMWMNTRRRFPGKGRNPGSLADIARIAAIWDDARQRFGAGGPYLFGSRLTLADAMYAPVVSRFVTWEPDLPASAKTYVSAVWEHPLLVEWRKAAEAEPWILTKYETPGA